MYEIIRIARSTLLLDDLVPMIGSLSKRMLNQGADRWKIVNQYNKAIMNPSHIFKKFPTRYEHLIDKFLHEL